ncbi:hypothetical protein LWI28_016025 [Acer negundo]|uniref:TF-B3 domain-containing protein n=1 Tax=Acer negundo TaxID=4023 RepID=A0AAD5IZP8_ACENE|nr:hypothetical protein LWI28_016025 [Acer negundo]
METNKTRDSMERLVAQRIRFQYGDARPILHWICSSRSPPSKSEPSSSNSLAETTSHFFKVILSATLQDKKLRIPEKFVRKFGDELSDVATLRVPNGRVWHVRLTKDGKKIWFHVGWNDFVKYHSICVGYFLVFKYGKNSNFDVLIFDMTACEIQYPYYCGGGLKNDENKLRRKRCKLEELDEIKTSHAIVDESEFKKAVCKVEVSSSDEENERIKFDGLDYQALLKDIGSTGGRNFRNISGEERVRAITAVKLFRPKNPSFMVILRPDNLRRSRAVVPTKFAKKCLSSDSKWIKLQDSDGSEWSALTMCKDEDYKEEEDTTKEDDDGDDDDDEATLGKSRA